MPASGRYFTKRFFGVEFEVGNEKTAREISDVVQSNARGRTVVCQNGWAQSINNEYWHVKYDSTCGPLGKGNDFGWEIASFKASGIDDLLKISEVGTKLAESNCLVNNNCGFHVHADVADFSANDMGMLLARWLKIEGMLCQLMPQHRTDNYYCKLISKSRKIALKKKHKAIDVWTALKPTNFGAHENRQKKVTLNTVIFAHALSQEERCGTPVRKTIEFRMPEGTLDPDAVVNWVRFFINFIEVSKAKTMPSNLLGVDNLKNFFKFCGLETSKKTEISSGLLGTKLWLLKRFHNYGSSEIKTQIADGLF